MLLISSWWQLGSTANCSAETVHSWDGKTGMKHSKEKNCKPHSDKKLEAKEHEKLRLLSKTNAYTENLACPSAKLCATTVMPMPKRTCP